jgi:tRNA(Arg) A34 adenosine deaminase TadA
VNGLFLSEIKQPAWLAKYIESCGNRIMTTPEERIRFTIRLALENVKNGTGGPFGAALFERKSNRLFAAGVNVVVPSGQTLAHAELMALSNAERLSGAINLSDYEIVSSCEPCVMCFGGIMWSRVTSLLYGAPGSFAGAVGFDEGDKVPDWHSSLTSRGIEVAGPMLIEEANEPFELYRRLSGQIY